jgi:arylsulfatase A-like enzyme
MLVLSFASLCGAEPVLRPNVVWIVVEDMSADFSCYRDAGVRTPAVDALAAEGTKFTRAYVTAPICSICRSALITGRYQTSIGAQHHRSSVQGHRIQLPVGVRLVPEILREAGYHTNNLTLEAFLRGSTGEEPVKVAKTDYNFEWNERAAYDAVHWTARGRGKPFFVQVQLNGGKYRGQAPGSAWPERVKQELGRVTDPASVKLPPWLPDDPVIRADWAQYLDTVRMTDHEVGRVVARLREAGELDRTVIFFMTDHGVSHVRNKQFLYDGGVHVPLVVRGPGIAAGEVRDDVVEHIDLAACTVVLAGLPVRGVMHGRNVLGEGYEARRYVFAARDRADETEDLIRSVRDRRWKYIRNGFPNRPWLQPNRYKDEKAVLQAMRRLHAAGKLTAEQALIMAAERPVEELYDCETDPHEFRNLAKDPAHAAVLVEMRQALRDWQARTGDPADVETEEVYRIETTAQHPGGGKNQAGEIYRRNVETMLRWRRERPLVK